MIVKSLECLTKKELQKTKQAGISIEKVFKTKFNYIIKR